MITQIVFNLILVIGCIMAFFYISNKLRNKQSSKESSIEMLSSLSIGTKEKIILINAGGSRLLLGITPTTITTLKCYDYVEPELATEPVFKLADKISNG